MPDANKFNKLRSIGYMILPTCRSCPHAQIKPGAVWNEPGAYERAREAVRGLRERWAAKEAARGIMESSPIVIFRGGAVTNQQPYAEYTLIEGEVLPDRKLSPEKLAELDIICASARRAIEFGSWRHEPTLLGFEYVAAELVGL